MSGAPAIRASIEELAAAVRAGRQPAQRLAETVLARAGEVDDEVHAYLSIDRERALASAAGIDRRVARGEDPGPLAGIPIAVKDNILTRGRRTTCGSRILENFVAVYSATVVERIESAGAVIVGKTNLDEFGMGSSTEHSAFGATRNPWNLARVPGGSSGGSAAAVAAGEAVAALGSDTGGSVLQPAGFCGLIGLKPQYGRFSRYGLVAFASSLEQIGPLARSARDAALLYNAVHGEDPLDATSLPGRRPIDLEGLETPPRGLRLGVPRSWFGEGLDPEVRRVQEETEERFRTLGARIEAVELISPRQIIATYYILADAEASSNLARYDGVRYGRRAPAETLDELYAASRGEGFGLEVKRRILLGTYVLSAGYHEAYYAQAQKARVLVRRSFEHALGTCDAILLPTAPAPAFAIGEKIEDPLAMYLCDVFTLPANLLGNPAVSFPAGSSLEGLPIGMQLIGRAGDEGGLLRLVRAHETVHDGRGSCRDPASPLDAPIGPATNGPLESRGNER